MRILLVKVVLSAPVMHFQHNLNLVWTSNVSLNGDLIVLFVYAQFICICKVLSHIHAVNKVQLMVVPLDG